MRKTTLLKTFLLLCALMVGGSVWAQSDHSSDYTGNITLSTSGGTQATDCIVNINSDTYSGIKAGTGKAAGAVRITVPSGTKYLHLHVAGWNAESVTLSVTPTGNGAPTSISLTANSGISGSSPFIFNGNANTESYYKVITFTNALTEDTYYTFTATGGKRFVVWGVTAEEGGSSNLQDSNLALTGAPVALSFDLYDNSAAQTVSFTTSSTGAVTVSGGTGYVTTSVSGNTITVTPVAVTPSAQTITVSQAADNNYVAGSVTFTVSISDSSPVLDETFVFSQLDYANAADITTVEGSYCTLTFDEGTGSNPPKYYTTGTAARMYTGNTLTISSTRNIVEIEFTFSESSYAVLTLPNNQPGTLTDVSSDNKRTWSGSATSVVFTTTATNRIQSIKVTVEDDGTPIVIPAAQPVTWDLSTNSYSSATENLVTWSSDYVIMTNSKGNSSTNANNYLGGDTNNRTSSRFYTGNILTITPGTNCAITSVVFTAASENYATALKNSAWTNATASASSTTVTVTPTNGINDISATIGGTCGFTSVTVNFYEYIPVTITAAKYATFSNARAMDFSETGITVYTAVDNENSVTLNEITSGQVPANTPVVLYKADADGTAIDVPVIASADAVEGTNDLRVSTGTDVDNMYVLAMNPTIGFYPWKGETDLSAGRVYLQGKASYGTRTFIGFGEETNISNASVNATDNNIWYDLQGRRVAQPTKGLYIVNGKKVLVK